MRLSIIKEDKSGYINSQSYWPLDVSCIPDNVRAFQWFGTNGWVEFNDGSYNQDVTELPSWAITCIQEWETADYAAKNPPPPTQEELIQQCKDEAKLRLLTTDYSELPDVKANLLNSQDFVAYRAAIRNIYLNPVVDPVWPNEPKAQWQRV